MELYIFVLLLPFFIVREINTLKGKLIITNTLGQLVYSNSVNLKAGLNYVQLDLTSFSTGIYTVILETELGTCNKKISLNK